VTIALLQFVGQQAQSAFINKTGLGNVAAIPVLALYLLLGPYLLVAAATSYSGARLLNLALFCANSLLWAVVVYAIAKLVFRFVRRRTVRPGTESER
jgi:hypothetical protein